MSMKNSDDIIRNRTHDLLACSAVALPTAQPRAPQFVFRFRLNKKGTIGTQYNISKLVVNR